MKKSRGDGFPFHALFEAVELGPLLGEMLITACDDAGTDRQLSGQRLDVLSRAGGLDR